MGKIGPFVGLDYEIGPFVGIGPVVGIGLFGGTCLVVIVQVTNNVLHVSTLELLEWFFVYVTNCNS